MQAKPAKPRCVVLIVEDEPFVRLTSADLLAEAGFHAWNLDLDRGLGFDEGVAALSGRFPHRAGLIAAFHHRWHETVPGEVAGSVAILQALAAAGVPLYAITNLAAGTTPECLSVLPLGVG